MVQHEKDNGVVPGRERRVAQRRGTTAHERRVVEGAVSNAELMALVTAVERAAREAREAEREHRQRIERSVDELRADLRKVYLQMAAWAGAAGVVGMLAGYFLRGWLEP